MTERRSSDGPKGSGSASPYAAEVRAPVLLISHSTRPRGGLVHTLSLGEALLAQGVDAHLAALGDPAAGLFRPTSLPHVSNSSCHRSSSSWSRLVFVASA